MLGDIFGEAILRCFFEILSRTEDYMIMVVVAVGVVFQNRRLLCQSGLHWRDGERVRDKALNTTGYKERCLGECVNCGQRSNGSLNLV